MSSSRKPPTQRTVRVWLHPALTDAEARKLKARANADMRSLGAYVTDLNLRELPARPGARVGSPAHAAPAI